MSVYKSLLEHFHSEKETVARAKLIAVIGQMVQKSGMDPGVVLDDIVVLLKNETSHVVLASLVDALHLVGLQAPSDKRIQQKAVQIAKQVGCSS